MSWFTLSTPNISDSQLNSAGKVWHGLLRYQKRSFCKFRGLHPEQVLISDSFLVGHSSSSYSSIGSCFRAVTGISTTNSTEILSSTSQKVELKTEHGQTCTICQRFPRITCASLPQDILQKKNLIKNQDYLKISQECEEGSIFVLSYAAQSFTPFYIRFSLCVSLFFSAHLAAPYQRFLP